HRERERQRRCFGVPVPASDPTPLGHVQSKVALASPILCTMGFVVVLMFFWHGVSVSVGGGLCVYVCAVCRVWCVCCLLWWCFGVWCVFMCVCVLVFVCVCVVCVCVCMCMCMCVCV